MNHETQDEDIPVEHLLRLLDHEPPDVSADDVIARAEAQPEAPLSTARHTNPWWRIAAGILIASMCAAGAYALPNSLVRAWVDDVARRIGSVTEAKPPAEAAMDTGSDAGGVAFDVMQPVEVVFRPRRATNAHARIRLTDDPMLRVLANPSAGVFTLEPDRMIIEPVASDTFDVRIPRSAPNVEVRVGDRSVFLKQGDRIRVDGELGADSVYVFRLESRN